LWINGGLNTNFTAQMKFDSGTQALCVASGMVTAALYQTPNQPIVFSDDPTHQSREEDAIVAYTWSHFLNHTDKPYWLLHLPMTKAAVRALDTIQAFLPTLNKASVPKINNFAVLGASKRGWTTWLTAAVDARVKIFIPIVIPVLDLVNSLNRLFQPYGEWSFILSDYLNNGIMQRLNTPEMELLAGIEDPFTYNERYLNKPFYLIDAAEDEFFLPDSTSVFWSKLGATKKFMKLLPKTDHFMKGYQMDVVNNVNTFIQMNLRNQPVRPTNPLRIFLSELYFLTKAIFLDANLYLEDELYERFCFHHCQRPADAARVSSGGRRLFVVC
jgi:PhoPQ-activated pathogenicity-related protein